MRPDPADYDAILTPRPNGPEFAMRSGQMTFHRSRKFNSLVVISLIAASGIAASAAAEPTAEDTWTAIGTTGWPDSLTAFRQKFQSGKSYVALYKKLPTSAIDMRSPNRFKNSMSSNELTNKSSIGHMSIGWSCTESPEAKRLDGFAAQTGENNGQSNVMLQSGWGVTALVSTFTDGYIQNGFQIQKYFSEERAKKLEKGKTPNIYTALVVEVPNDECMKVRDFVKSYVSHPSQPSSNFGMMPDPEKFEGAGCGSFAAVALSKSPSLAPLLTTFWRTIEIPEKLFGRRTRVFAPNNVDPALIAKVDSDQIEVGKVKLLLMNWDSGPMAMRLRLVDPELVIYSLRRFTDEALKGGQATPSRSQERQISQLRRSLNLGDAGYQELDATFDSSFLKVSTAVDQWLATSRAKVQLVQFEFGQGVMIASE